MGADTKIEWAHHSFNPWEGCQKVGPGCDHCYAEARNRRFGGGVAPNWGPGADRRRTSVANWAQPLKWDRAARDAGERRRVFCASLADVFDNAVQPDWRFDLAALIVQTPHLDWLLLTKRIGNAARMLEEEMFGALPAFPLNVWIGATVVDQGEADREVPKLLATPAAKRFLSIEPMLGPVDLTRVCMGESDFDPEPGAGLDGINRIRFNINALAGVQSFKWPALDWVIVGGESGRDARPMHPDWARSLRDQCVAADVPFLFKQWGLWAPLTEARPAAAGSPGMIAWPDGRVGLGLRDTANEGRWLYAGHQGVTGRLLDGVAHDGVPS